MPHHDPVLWIPSGNWAEWTGSLLAGLSLIGLVIGLHRERGARRRDERDKAEELRVGQARHVAVWVEITGGTSGPPPVASLIIHVVNTSDETVYNCHVSSRLDVPGPGIVDQWPIGTIPPAAQIQRSTSVEIDPKVNVGRIDQTRWISELMFTDANGRSWTRTHFGLLVERTDPAWADLVHLPTVQRSRELQERWRQQREAQESPQ